MEKKYQVIIFDFVDTLAHGSSIQAIREELEREVGPGVIDHMIDGGNIDVQKSADEIVARAKAFCDISPAQEALIRRWIFPGNITLYPDTRETLEYLKGRGYTLGIISNTPPIEQNDLPRLGIAQYIDHEVYSFECGYRKPDTRIFQVFLEKSGFGPSDALMIGNSLVEDIQGAQSAGIDVLLIDRQGRETSEPKITSLLELKNIL